MSGHLPEDQAREYWDETRSAARRLCEARVEVERSLRALRLELPEAVWRDHAEKLAEYLRAQNEVASRG